MNPNCVSQVRVLSAPQNEENVYIHISDIFIIKKIKGKESSYNSELLSAFFTTYKAKGVPIFFG